MSINDRQTGVLTMYTGDWSDYRAGKVDVTGNIDQSATRKTMIAAFAILHNINVRRVG